ncbi:hypothetical protein ACP3T3_11895 [Chryseobacterium sp. CBSDS_008]|uniref:hypothetical protein n=1 Tax=Chryseobacterium sp. CBSDS_008 TaxID=3415265 RepID=UPI003CEDAA81
MILMQPGEWNYGAGTRLSWLLFLSSASGVCEDLVGSGSSGIDQLHTFPGLSFRC